jgi:hypothetical protein
MTRIISFHNGNIPQEVLDAQKAVFNHFELPLEQIETQLQHPDAIDHFLHNEQWDTVVIFDIDCIPLKADSIKTSIQLSKYALVGAAQHASHIPGSADYCSPAFMVLNRDVWEKIGKPSFAPTSRADVGGEVSIAANSHPEVPIMLSYPLHVEKPMWKYDDGSMFGIGTDYGTVYHAFESRMNEDARKRFIRRCQEVVAAAAL